MTRFGPPPQVPLLGQGKQKIQAQQFQRDVAINTLAAQIYVKMAASQSYPLTDETKDQLREMAKDAYTAALCYFEGLTEQKGDAE